MMYHTKLLDNIAIWMISHGSINNHISRSNEYTGVEIYELTWRGIESSAK